MIYPIYLFLHTNTADPDLWGHIKIGEYIVASGDVPRHDIFSFSAPGADWVSEEWLAQLLFFQIFRTLGSPGLVLFKGLMIATLLSLTYRLIRTSAPSLSVQVPVFVISSLWLGTGFACRPQLFTYLGTVLILFLFHRFRRRANAWIWYLTPWLIVPWSWIHGGFLAGAGICMLIGLGEGFKQWRLKRPATVPVAGLLSSTLLALSATAVNPYGTQLWTRLYNTLTLPTHRMIISEWQPVWASQDAFQCLDIGLCALMLGISFFMVPSRDFTDWLLACVGLGISFESVRHLPLAAILCVAPIAQGLEGLRTRLLGKGDQRFPAGSFYLCLNITLIGLCTYLLVWVLCRLPAEANIPLGYAKAEAEPDRIVYPKGAVRFIQQNRLSGKLWNDFNVGNYVIWHLFPQCQVFIDSRAEHVYSARVMLDFMRYYFDVPGWEALLAIYSPDLLLMRAGHPAVPRFLAGRAWRPIYADPDYILLAQDKEKFGHLIEKYQRHLVAIPRPLSPGYFP